MESKNNVLGVVVALIIGFVVGYIAPAQMAKNTTEQPASVTNYNKNAASKASPKALTNANLHSSLLPCPPKVGDPYGVIRPTSTNPASQTVPYPTSQFTVLEFEIEGYDCAIWLDKIATSVQYIGNSVPAGTPQIVSNYRLYDITAGYPGSLVAIAPATPQCADGVDNDSDGFTDFPNDPQCDSAGDDDEVSIFSVGNLGPVSFRPNGPFVGYPINPGAGNVRKFAIKADVINPPIYPWDSGVQFFMGNIGAEFKDFGCVPYMTCPYINMDVLDIKSNTITFQ